MSFDDSQAEGGERTFIVGVVGDIRHHGLRTKIAPTVYVPFVQKDPSWPPTILVRSQLPERALLAAVYGELSRLGPAAAVWASETLGRHIDDSIFRERLFTVWSPMARRGGPARLACASRSVRQTDRC